MIAPLVRNGVHPKKAPLPSTVVCPWYTVYDLAILFNVVDRTIWKWVESGRIPRPIKRGRKWTHWPKDVIDQLLASWAAEVDHG